MINPQWVNVRAQHGGVYITEFPDGIVVPWKPLPIGEFLKYDADLSRCVIPPASLEDEVFRKCVLDDDLLQHRMNELPAGVITTVVHNIWEYSGPETPQQLQSDFEEARNILQGSRSSIIHECAYMIATGFSYTLEQVYAMDYETFLLRLAQAEAKMLTMRIITAPLTLNIGEAQQPEVKPRVKLDAKQAWEQQQAAKLQQKPQPQPTREGKWWEVSPILESQKRAPINFHAEQQATDDMNLDSHERGEKGAMRKHILDSKLGGKRAQMLDDAKIIYKDVIEALEKTRK